MYITYAYDAAGSRVSQTTGNTTTVYPNQYFSLVTTSGMGSSTAATSTLYAYDGSTLLATIDQSLMNGTATGRPIIRYIHPDNQGSTQASSDESGHLAQYFSYAPYGSVLASTNRGSTATARQYIGQFSDPSGLSYLNARYYNGSQGQFLSQDPVFLGNQNLSDPQSLNPYSYSNDNPVTKSDPTGLFTQQQNTAIANVANAFGVTTFSSVQSSAIGSLAMSFGVPTPLITNLTGVSAGSLSGSNKFMQATSPSQMSPISPSSSIGPHSGVPGQCASSMIGCLSGAGTVSGSGEFPFPNLQDHFDRHGSNFGAQSPDEYSGAAQDFLNRGLNNENNSIQLKYNESEKTLRAYEESTNSFGSYNTDAGGARTFYKPTEGASYWEGQTGEAISSEAAAELFGELFFGAL